jgi:hypothetical protein
MPLSNQAHEIDVNMVQLVPVNTQIFATSTRVNLNFQASALCTPRQHTFLPTLSEKWSGT